MKTEFELEMGPGNKRAGHTMNAKIIGMKPNDAPFVSIYAAVPLGPQMAGWIPEDQLERFAVNILKAIKSNKLK